MSEVIDSSAFSNADTVNIDLEVKQPTEVDQSQLADYEQHRQLQASVDPSTCIVLHPGSRNLRLGRPTDSQPYTMLHAIARRLKNTNSTSAKRRDPFIVPLAKMSSDKLQEVEDCRIKVSTILQSCLMSDGTRRFATPLKQIAAHNRRVTPVTDESAPPCPSLLHPTAECVVGNEVLKISPDAPYHTHFPWQRGDLNLQPGLSSSITAVMADLEAIWTYAIEHKLNIPQKEFKNYRCCVVIPALYCRERVVHITRLLLDTLGFAACFVFQDHVAATFGSGVGSACVVDVGDQQTSVSCVEDALSIPSSRLRLEHGGSDICQVLHWLLRKSGFPRSLDPASCDADATLLEAVKLSACHVDLDKCGVQELKLQVMEPGCKPASYSIQVGDELLLAPLSLCYPALLQLTGDKTRVLVQAPNSGHSEDPFDDLYLRDTSRRGGKEASEGAGEVGDEDMAGVDENLNGRPDPCSSAGPVLSGLLSLEQAIHASIERCAEETRRRMYSCILLVGAGANFPHLGKWLQSRLPLQIPMTYRPEQLEVITRAKDLDPGTIAWKGAALMTGLEGSGELWLTKAVWHKHGVRALREKCPFIW